MFYFLFLFFLPFFYRYIIRTLSMVKPKAKTKRKIKDCRRKGETEQSAVGYDQRHHSKFILNLPANIVWHYKVSIYVYYNSFSFVCCIIPTVVVIPFSKLCSIGMGMCIITSTGQSFYSEFLSLMLKWLHCLLAFNHFFCSNDIHSLAFDARILRTHLYILCTFMRQQHSRECVFHNEKSEIKG